MRIRITLSADKPSIIDFNYQHQIQAMIYGFISRSNPDYAQWLHQQGFVYKKDQRFKLFVFSGITFDGSIKITRSMNTNRSISSNRRDGFSFNASQTNPFTFSFQIASPVDKFIQHLIDGIFQEGSEITLGRQKATIYRIETLPEPIAFNSEIQNPKFEILLKPLESPLFIKKPMPPGQQDVYLFPGDEGYEGLLNQNLMHKYDTLYGKPFEGEPLQFYFHAIRGKSVKCFTVFKRGADGGVKSIDIKGTLQPFTVTGPRELIWTGLECGFGQNNSMGCGYVETDKKGQGRQDLRSATNEHE